VVDASLAGEILGQTKRRLAADDSGNQVRG